MCAEQSTLRYRIIKPNEFTNEFESLVLRTFFFAEPMTKHFGITKSDECITLFLRKVLEKAKQDQVSLGCFDKQIKNNVRHFFIRKILLLRILFRKQIQTNQNYPSVSL